MLFYRDGSELVPVGDNRFAVLSPDLVVVDKKKKEKKEEKKEEKKKPKKKTNAYEER
jgi:hypothetical protein